jgi:tetratricopeptide (TPR) repeat protein
MGKFTTFLFIIYFGLLGYFGILNQDHVTVTVTKSYVYEMPKVLLLLISSTVGAFLMFLAFLVKDTRKFIQTIQQQKKTKKEERISALYSKALDAFFAQRWEDSQAILEQILKGEPEHIDSILKLGGIKFNAREYAAAFNYYKRAYAIDPTKTETLFALAEVKEATGAYPDALVYIDEILEHGENNIRAFYRKRDLLEKMDKWDDLVLLQKNIIKMKKSERGKAREQERLIGYKYEQGRASLEVGDLEKAEKAFRTLLRLDRDFIPAHLGLAEVIFREENADDAVTYLENVYVQTKSLIVLARLEDLLISIGEPGRLINIYRNALTNNPDNISLKLLLGKLYHRLEMLDDALDILHSIDYAGSSYPEISKILGNIYLKRNQPDRAAEEFKKVIDIKKAFRVPYCCSNCGFFAVEWSGRCPSCKSWDTYQFDIFDSCKLASS